MIARLIPLALLIASPCAAEIEPTPGIGDPRLQTVVYDASQVVVLRGAPGYAIAVEFSPDERIENVAVGDSGGWQVTPNRRGDALFIKPVGNAQTSNLTVITDVRRYNFSLVSLYSPQPNMPFSVRFIYPAPVASETSAVIGPTLYRMSGDEELWPSEMSDDGQATSISWPAGATMPAIYAIDDRGHETIVNGAMRDGYYVVDSIADRFVFRLGRQRATARRLPQDNAR
jgi:type IV secretion system protein VirB9